MGFQLCSCKRAGQLVRQAVALQVHVVPHTGVLFQLRQKAFFIGKSGTPAKSSRSASGELSFQDSSVHPSGMSGRKSAGVDVGEAKSFIHSSAGGSFIGRGAPESYQGGTPGSEELRG